MPPTPIHVRFRGVAFLHIRGMIGLLILDTLLRLCILYWWRERYRLYNILGAAPSENNGTRTPGQRSQTFLPSSTA